MVEGLGLHLTHDGYHDCLHVLAGFCNGDYVAVLSSSCIGVCAKSHCISFSPTLDTDNSASSPFTILADSSFQDCPDTSHSTGGYLVFLYGACMDHYSDAQLLVAHSSCEAEYRQYSLSLMAAAFLYKLHNEFLGFDLNCALTIQLGVYSQSAIDTAILPKETAQTCRI